MMFSLLIKGNGWSDGGDSLPIERVFEYTDSSIQEKFKPDGKLDIPSLIRLPALFMQERFKSDDPVARVGVITHARLYGGDIHLEYVFESSIPPIKNSKLNEFSTELKIDDFEFQRTHWAVKDTDLFKALLRNMQPRRQMPKVFRLENSENINPSLVSAMMPFHPSFDAVYESIKRASFQVDLHCHRADDIWENPEIIQDIVSLIDHSRIVVCDCTGRNPNVFYEIGIAHTLGREVILITQQVDDIPFDLRHLRFIKYLNNSEGLEEFYQQLKRKFSAVVGI